MYNLLLKNRITNSILIVLLLIGLRIVLLVNPIQEYSGPSGFLYDCLFIEFSSIYSWLASTFLLIVQIYILLDLCLRFKISSELTLIPGLAFVLIICLIPEFGQFQPILISNTFLLFALNQLFEVSSRKPSERKIYNVGLWLAMAALMYSSYALLIIAFISGINMLRSYRIGDLKVLLLGFITPYFLTGAYFFWIDILPFYFDGILKDLGFISLGSGSGDPYHKGILAFIIIVLIVLVINNGSILVKKTIIKQNYFRTVYWMMLTCAITLLVQENITIHHLGILAIPMSLLISELLIVSKPSISKAVVNFSILIILIYQFKESLLALFFA